MNNINNKIAVAVLCTTLEQANSHHFREEQLKSGDVFFIIDAPFSNAHASSISLKYYKNSVKGTSIEKEFCAIDKFFYTFCELCERYDFVLLIEYDVFCTEHSILNFIEKYSKYDLVVSKLEKKTNDILDWNWKSALGRIEKPWYRTMACAAGLSRKMLNEIKTYAHENKTLFNSEIMLPTLAVQKNLKVFCPPELKSIVWKANWSFDEIMKLPENFFHPYKKIEQHEKVNRLIEFANKIGYEPANNLPHFLRGGESE